MADKMDEKKVEMMDALSDDQMDQLKVDWTVAQLVDKKVEMTVAELDMIAVYNLVYQMVVRKVVKKDVIQAEMLVVWLVD